MKKKHWWLKDGGFKRVGLTNLYRLGLLFLADVMSGKEKDSVSSFLLWLEQYMYDPEV